MLPYLLSALYYLKIAKGNVFAIAGSIYGVWMIISAGIVQFLITSILYAPGIWVYMKGRKEKGLEPFKPFERRIAMILVVMAIVSIVLMFIGVIDPF